MLFEHAPATLEMKDNVRLGVSLHFVLTAVLGRQFGETPLFWVAARRPSEARCAAMLWITDRLPCQVLEQNNGRACRVRVIHC
jgi:hypothetical protein